MADIKTWSTVDDDSKNQQPTPDGFPEGQTPASLNDCSRAVMGAVRRWYDAPEFVDLFDGETFSRQSATVVVVHNGDFASYFNAGRRIKVIGDTIDLGFVVSASYDGNDTLVTVDMDSDDVPTNPTAIELAAAASLGQAAYLDPGDGPNDIPVNSDLPVDAAGANMLINGDFSVWQRGISATISDGVDSYLADHWKMLAVGADLPIQQVKGSSALPPGALSEFALEITGATGGTGLGVMQRVEADQVAGYKRTVTFSAWIRNQTGAAFSPILQLETPDARNNFSVTTSRVVQVLQSCPDAAWTQVSHTLDLAAVTDIENGLQVELGFAAGLDSGTKTITLAELQIRTLGWVPKFRRRTYTEELRLCQRYFETTFPSGVAPATQAGRAGCVEWRTAQGPSGDRGSWTMEWRFKATKAYTPAVALFNPVNDNQNAHNFSDDQDLNRQPVQATVSTENAVYESEPGSSTGDSEVTAGVHLAATAEL